MTDNINEIAKQLKSYVKEKRHWKGTENQSSAYLQCDFFKTVQKIAQIY